MTTPKEAKGLLLNKYKNSKIVNAFDLESKYLFTLYPKDKNPSEDLLLDSFYTVDKKNGEIKEYSPLFNLDEFRKKKRINV